MGSVYAVGLIQRSVDGWGKNICIVTGEGCVMTLVMYCMMSRCVVMSYNPLWWDAKLEDRPTEGISLCNRMVDCKLEKKKYYC